MHVTWNQKLKEQISSFRLAFNCEKCGFYSVDDGQCSILYPTKDHISTATQDLEEGDRVYFCKMFEAL